MGLGVIPHLSAKHSRSRGRRIMSSRLVYIVPNFSKINKVTDK